MREPPADYPDSVPFLPGRSCRVLRRSVRGVPVMVVLWWVTDAPREPGRQSPLPALDGLLDDFGLRDIAAEPDPSKRKEQVVEAMQNLRSSDARSRDASPSDHDFTEKDPGFQTVLEQTLDQGWVAVANGATRRRTCAFVRDGRNRVIIGCDDRKMVALFEADRSLA